MEYRENSEWTLRGEGEMERWSSGVGGCPGPLPVEMLAGVFELPPLFRHSIVSTVDAIRFVDDQCFGPRTGIAFSFQRFDQAQKAVFEFECLAIERLILEGIGRDTTARSRATRAQDCLRCNWAV